MPEPAQSIAMDHEHEGTGTLTRHQVATALGVGRTTVRRLEEDGTLRPVVDGEGVHRFDRAEVERVVRQRSAAAAGKDDRTGPSQAALGALVAHDGDVAAKAFQAFSDGLDPVAAVIALKIAPALIADLHRQWVELRGGLVLCAEARREIERTIGAPITAENVGQVMTILVRAAVRAKVDRPRFPQIGPPGS